MNPPDSRWYKDAVIYEIPVKSFYDSNGDGLGDLKGLVLKLDYLKGLGVDCLWLLPFYQSPLRDDGYDISDYYRIHPDLGSLEDFDLLIEEAHRRGLRVIADLVLNHVSDQHPWFQEARSDPAGPRRPWFVWSDSDRKYAGTRIIFLDTERSNWTWDPVAKQYYWHRFYSHQPDLNYEPPPGPRGDEGCDPVLAPPGTRRIPMRRRAVPLGGRRYHQREPTGDPRLPEGDPPDGRRRVSGPGPPGRGQPVAHRCQGLLR
ncbi:trehalose synthase [mine drainage metagenome]|uniref:Trehalose synthase n=1 Tax=mine drainage metagenome TaxID=410659 RepID=T1AKR8_9ZZZZ